MYPHSRPKFAAQLVERLARAAEQPRELRVVNAKRDEADIYLYEEIGFWGVTASDFQQALAPVTASRINLHVNSPGGEVFDGLAIYNMLRDHSATVTAYVDGVAASAASFITLAAEQVVMAQSSFMFIHDAMSVVWGYARDMRREADVLDKLSDTIADIYSAAAGGSRQSWRDAMGDETWYSADEAKAAGLANEVSGAAVEGDPRARYRESITALFAEVIRDRRADLETPAVPTVPAGARTPATTHTNRLPAVPPVDALDVGLLDIELERDRLAVASAELWRP